MNFILKHLKYLRYVVVHKFYVLQECITLGRKHGNLIAMIYRGIMHDMSKFLPSEWFPYVEYFEGSWDHEYGCPVSIDNAFNLAWRKHIQRNPHHWQHHLLFKDSGKLLAMEVPETYIMEMVADWHGAGRMWGKNNTAEWYGKNSDKQVMCDYTRKRVEIYLGCAK